tara:strand:+ start:251 stop:505 length:255 start_codon:yes stop_codon:yes gene_type:complete
MQWVQLPPELKQGLQKANIVSNQLLTQQLLERQRANVTSYLQLAHLRLSNSLTSQQNFRNQGNNTHDMLEYHQLIKKSIQVTAD